MDRLSTACMKIIQRKCHYGLFLIVLNFFFVSMPVPAQTANLQKISTNNVSGNSTGQLTRNKSIESIRYNRMVILKGENIRDLLTCPIANLALFSWKQESWHRIPMQVDQASTSESIHYIENSEPEIDGDPKLLDPADEVVFLAKDAGDKCPESITPENMANFLQIRLEDPIESKTGYVYLGLYKNKAPELSTAPVIEFNDKLLQFYGNRYTIELDPENQLLIRKIIYNQLSGDRNLIDYIRGETVVTMALGLKLKRDVDDVRGKLIAVKTGPVRTISHIKVTVHYGPFTIAKVFTEVAYSDLGVVIPIQTAIPTKKNWLMFGASKMIKKIHTSVGLDFNCDPEGEYRIISALNQPFIVDGRKQSEEDANGVRVNIKEPWVLIANPNGASVFGYLDLNILGNIKQNAGKLSQGARQILAEAENNMDEIETTEFTPQQINMRQIPGIEHTNLGEVMEVSDQTLELVYMDDATADDPEGQYPGHLPYVGFEYQLNNINQTLKAFNKLIDDPDKDIPDTINIVNTLYIFLLPDSIMDGKYLYDVFQNPPRITAVQTLTGG